MGVAQRRLNDLTCLSMGLAPIKKAYRDVARERSHKLYRIKLYRGETVS